MQKTIPNQTEDGKLWVTLSNVDLVHLPPLKLFKKKLIKIVDPVRNQRNLKKVRFSVIG